MFVAGDCWRLGGGGRRLPWPGPGPLSPGSDDLDKEPSFHSGHSWLHVSSLITHHAILFNRKLFILTRKAKSYLWEIDSGPFLVFLFSSHSFSVRCIWSISEDVNSIDPATQWTIHLDVEQTNNIRPSLTMTPLLPVCLVLLANLDVLSSLQLGVKTRYGAGQQSKSHVTMAK